jgi:hypothetical protein
VGHTRSPPAYSLLPESERSARSPVPPEALDQPAFPERELSGPLRAAALPCATTSCQGVGRPIDELQWGAMQRPARPGDRARRDRHQLDVHLLAPSSPPTARRSPPRPAPRADSRLARSGLNQHRAAPTCSMASAPCR